MCAMTREWVDNYDAAPLRNGDSFWGQSHQQWTDHFGRARADVEGLGYYSWQGHGQQAALDRMKRDEATMQEAADVAMRARQTASRGADTLAGLRSDARSHIADAEEDGFEVKSNLGVSDTVDDYPDQETADERQSAANEHCARICYAVQRLHNAHQEVNTAMRAHGQELDAIRFC